MLEKLLNQRVNFLLNMELTDEMIKGRWSVPVPEFKNRDLSDNYEAFMANLKGELSPSFEQLKDAAMSTWTGRWADKMGYSNIISRRNRD
jgi:ABC-type thiamine transport system substrate-binding protein